MQFIENLPIFLLVFVRLTGFFLSAPIWANRQIPGPFKWGFSFFIALLVFGLIDFNDNVVIDGNYIFLVFKEAFVGLCLGFFAGILLYAVQLAGSFVDLQSGLGMATLFDPQTGVQEPLTGRFFYMLTMLFFLTVDGHHLLIHGIMASYDWIPVDTWIPEYASGNLVVLGLDLLKEMFWLAFLIAVPIAGSLFLVDIALGILTKTAPQMNLFVVGIPIKMIVHFFVLFAFLPGFFYVLGKLISSMVHSFSQILRILGS
ncbi:flagellar biosynthetic protein FliR [Bacillus sp. B15-48]|uniref:flagellar biosynthetic protein FliR n=1 Tax=Bacillus sp. B15-48 TaxID=1548601 RepID=UPI00193F0F5A|nr:flagellar biosynthetic protein FliR [Bacillus sp. B15-48]MBM4764146.1 flagellar type III secretion system protein FliR [Bacillus sp. B15-48]